MYYAVASTRDFNGMMQVDFDKKGNKYVVSLRNKGRGEYTFRTFDTLMEALAVYQRFVEAFITGCYSYEDRKSWLKNEEGRELK